MLDKLIHKVLKVPYTLNVTVEKPSRGYKNTVLFIHGLGESALMWQPIIDRLPDDIKVISIDLLGFGGSPRPDWIEYNARNQARSVGATLLKLFPKRKLIVVGHSLGALVAVELARRYPVLVRELVLCSPPFYRQDLPTRRLFKGRDNRLKKLYRMLQKIPEQFVKLSNLAVKHNLINRAFDVTQDNVSSYMAALEASIVNQTSLEDAKKITKPMQIIHGSFDPLVIKKNLKHLTAYNQNASLKVIPTGHDIKSRTYHTAVVKAIEAALR